MRTLLFAFNFFILIQCLPAQVFDGYFYPQKKKGNLPSKFVWVEEQKMALKETEVTIGEYLFFIEKIVADSSTAYSSFFIPSAPCILADFVDLNEEDDSLERSIHWFDQQAFHKKYSYSVKDQYTIYDKPITGLSYEQASGYADWCTSYFNNYNMMEGIDATVSFRLPSPSEFEKYTLLGMTKCYEKQKAADREKTIKQLRECKNEKKCALCNYANKDICESNTKLISKFGNELYPVGVFFPNCFGAMDLQGNAAEMTSDKGIAKGGSYIHPASECQPEAVQNYTEPQSWLGFRLRVMVVKASSLREF
jgi:formylglycine-generating enzyme required for sulfatase activity